jgi:ribokinase
MVDLVAVGDVLLDVVAARPEAGERVHGPVVVRAGGSAVNAARAAAATGATVIVVGRIGDDAAGYAIRRELEQEGIDARLSVDAALPTGAALLLDDAVVATHGANAAVEVGELPEAHATLVSGHLGPEIVQRALAAARGLRVLDCQTRRDHLTERADVVIGGDGRADQIVCRTLGADGAVAVHDGERAEARPDVVRDGPLPGAGDAFAAVFALSLAHGLSMQAALQRACDAGARV